MLSLVSITITQALQRNILIVRRIEVCYKCKAHLNNLKYVTLTRHSDT